MSSSVPATNGEARDDRTEGRATGTDVPGAKDPCPSKPNAESWRGFGAFMFDVSLFGLLITFFLVGLSVIVAPDSELAHGALRIAGLEAMNAAPPPMPAAAAAPSVRQSLPAAPSVDMDQTQSASTDAIPVDSDVSQTDVEPRTEFTPLPDTRDESRDVQRAVADAIDRISDLESDYYIELQSLGWHSILDPWRIDQDEKLTKSRNICRQTSAAISKFESKTTWLIREERARIGDLPLSDEAKIEAATRFERAVIDARFFEVWALEKRSAAQVATLFEQLAAKKRGVDWKVEDGQLLFRKHSSLLAKRDAVIEEIRRIKEKKDEIYRDRR
jgi:hypothetical protein